MPPQEPAGDSRDSGGWLSADQPPLLPKVSPPVRWQGYSRPLPAMAAEGERSQACSPSVFQGGTCKAVSEGPLEGLAWVTHHVTAWLGPRRKGPGLGVGSRLGGAQSWPTSWSWAGGATPSSNFPETGKLLPALHGSLAT